VALSRASSLKYINIDRRDYGTDHHDVNMLTRKEIGELLKDILREQEEGIDEEPAEEVDSGDKTIDGGLVKLLTIETKSLKREKVVVKRGYAKVDRKLRKVPAAVEV
jgi:hypothetical protein